MWRLVLFLAMASALAACDGPDTQCPLGTVECDSRNILMMCKANPFDSSLHSWEPYRFACSVDAQCEGSGVTAQTRCDEGTGALGTCVCL